MNHGANKLSVTLYFQWFATLDFAFFIIKLGDRPIANLETRKWLLIVVKCHAILVGEGT
jgi:hypothetical protein